ncbi:hypothetical protein PRZ48_008738 [Zasmidium cellare]|uniref:Uncharacterized protein n=1 Tax=Zasmidium cellare TaxID=395010 RepID=A0ABR0EGQ0_ZASCE|nr:hypothetical protein PRZ48_008738 [Zasmidium cellare]
MQSSENGRPGQKPAGIKPKVKASKPRDSSLERHRQSYIRAWHAINQAKQVSAIESNELPRQAQGFQPESTSHSLRRSQSPANLIQRTAKSADIHDEASGSWRKQKTAPGTLEDQLGLSSIKKATPRSKTGKVDTTPEPAKPEEPRTPSDNESSQASGDGLFVTPNAKTVNGNTDRRSLSAEVSRGGDSLRLVPFPKRKSKRDLAAIFNAPDSLHAGEISKESLKAASRKAFGPKSVRKIYQSSPGVWMVRLLSQEHVRDGVRKQLVIGGVEVAVEKVPKVPSKVFAWKPGETEVMPSSKEIADKVRQTFKWPLPDVKVQGSPRQVTLSFVQCPELLRFYLRLGSGLEARFDPVSQA